MIAELDGPCKFPECDAKSAMVAAGRCDGFEEPRAYCLKHGFQVTSSGGEFLADCPNCGCQFEVG